MMHAATAQNNVIRPLIFIYRAPSKKLGQNLRLDEEARIKTRLEMQKAE